MDAEEDHPSAIDEAAILEDLAPYLLPDDDDSPPPAPPSFSPHHTCGRGRRSRGRQPTARNSSPESHASLTRMAGHTSSPLAHADQEDRNDAFLRILDSCRNQQHDQQSPYMPRPLHDKAGEPPLASHVTASERGAHGIRKGGATPLGTRGAPPPSVVSSLHTFESAYGPCEGGGEALVGHAFRVSEEDIVPMPSDAVGGEGAESCLCGLWDHGTNGPIEAGEGRHGDEARREESEESEAQREEQRVAEFLRALQRDMAGLTGVAETLLAEHERLRARGLELPSEPLLRELVQ